jgi:hypothetical protein
MPNGENSHPYSIPLTRNGANPSQRLANSSVSFRQQRMIVPENHALLPKAYYESATHPLIASFGKLV